jgi:hypothetical protein
MILTTSGGPYRVYTAAFIADKVKGLTRGVCQIYNDGELRGRTAKRDFKEVCSIQILYLTLHIKVL